MVTGNGKQGLNRRACAPFSAAAENGPLALYVHWPFCVHKCPYCDFNSHVARAFSEADYVEAVCLELDHMQGLSAARPVASIFFGGGTPSLMAPDSVAAIIAHMKARFELLPEAEITLEANPSSSEAARFEALKEAGINRLSLGVQALDDAALRRLERPHDVAEALAVIDMAARTFPRYSFDLIYARPGQTAEAWGEELRWALALAGGHISAYSLTIEPGTRFHTLAGRGELVLPQEEAAERFFDLTRELCSKAGLPSYEISNYAAPGEECRHNLAYWRYAPYIGVGPGAHGRLAPGRISNKSLRSATSTLRSPARWIEQVRERGHGIEALETLDAASMADEMLLMGLRLTAGVDVHDLRALTGHTTAPQAVAELVELGLMRVSGDGRYLAATDTGVKLLNPVIERLSRALVAAEAAVEPRG